ncbi:hypothetical protein CISG_05600 [Coccidioides immitis RMSCC 3703]|uniref:Uncharacterized protein n=1 Tax=Coccidioides immitis RMSCC 3703 TaxID=454286 RepID=A0A0J8TSL8_COCIT|nr:hypothetical protein CISG_05600 [Coccidioides immitis RMSCC 3703]
MDSSDEELVSDLEDRTDDIAASVLSQFIAVNADQRRRERPPESENRLVCVSIPRVDNEHEFLLLPGHSRVDRIVSKANDDAYQVELKSSDIIKASLAVVASFQTADAPPDTLRRSP